MITSILLNIGQKFIAKQIHPIFHTSSYLIALQILVHLVVVVVMEAAVYVVVDQWEKTFWNSRPNGCRNFGTVDQMRVDVLEQ